MQLGPNIWGPHLWKSLHMISIGYPNEPTYEQKKTYKAFYESIHLILPCPLCSDHYKEHLQKLPLTDEVMRNKKNLAHWVIDLHNIVNKSTGKPEFKRDDALLHIYNNFNDDKEKVIEKFSSINSNLVQPSETTSNFQPVWGLILLLAILVGIAVIYKKC